MGKAADHFVAQVYLMTPDEGGRKKPCTKDMQLICFSKTWDCAAYVELEGKEMAMPGEDATIKLRLLKPMVMEAGQHFTIRDHGGTIGTGKVTDIKDNLTDEERMLMQMNKEKRAKYLTKVSSLIKLCPREVCFVGSNTWNGVNLYGRLS